MRKITEFIPEQKNYTKAIKEKFDENFKEKIYLLKRIQDEENHKVLLNIFEIVSDYVEVNESLLKFIDKKTPVHNLFVFRTNEKEEFQYKLLLAYKEIYKDDDNKSLVKNIGKYFSTNWISKERYIEYTSDICIENIFEEFFFKISKYKKIEGESLKSIIEINDRIISLKSEIKKLNVKLGNEKQVNKRSEIHHKIQVYKQKLDEIENNVSKKEDERKLKIMKKINIAFDGPAASGKTTVAISVAKKLGWLFVDTGAMYRAVTWLALKNNIDISDKDSIIKLANENPVILKQDFSLISGCRVYIAGNDITTEIKSAGVNKNVSDVAKISEVRKCLVAQQKKMAENGGVIMVGRDITTVVMPNAELKIYLDASVEERARRRFNEEKALGRDVNFEDIKKSIENRDKIDSEREDSPLKASDDSVVLDSTNMTAEQVIDEVIKLVKERG